MTVSGVERQSKARQDNTLVDLATLQANYDRLWLHVRIIYVLLVVSAACYLATAFTLFSARQHFFTSPPTATPDSKVVWQNLSSSLEDGMTENGKQTKDALVGGRRRRSSSRRQRLVADADYDSDRRVDGLTRRLRAARASNAELPSSSWINHDDPKHDGLWMTMHSKIPVKLYYHVCLFNTIRQFVAFVYHVTKLTTHTLT